MLHLILGRAGSGKTEYVFNSINERVKNGEKDILLITPEQFSFIAERRLLSDLGEAGINSVESISFTRLSNEISRRYGGEKLPVLSKGAKAVMMKKAIESVQDSLTLFNKNITSVSFINSVISIYDELKSCRVTLEDITEAENSTDRETLKRKLHDLGLITGMYDALINDEYLDSANELTRLYEKLRGLTYFKDRTVFIDGFSGFVAQEYKIIEVILAQAKDVYFTFCTDSFYNTDNFNLFSYVNSNIVILKDVAKKIGTEIDEPVYLSAGKRYKSEELRTLENGIYFPVKNTTDVNPEHIKLYGARNIYDECDYTASKISSLLRSGYKASDIAVIVRDADKYKNELFYSFSKYNIPYFDDERQSITDEPLIMFVGFLLRTVIYSMRSEDIFSLLKTGLTTLDSIDIAELENYVYLWSISGTKWNSEFTQSTKGFVSEISENDQKRIDKLNKTRSYVINNINKFKRKCKDASCADIAKALYYTLMDFSVDENLRELAVTLDKNGKSALAHEQERVWELLMNILDELATVGGKENITVREFYKLFTLMISNEDLGVIPIGLDNVQLGAADRMRCNNPRAVFILGANEGEFPQSVTSFGLLSESDRITLINNDFKLYSYGDTLNAQERYFAYMALSSATEELYVSYRANEGKECYSSIIDEIKGVFKNIEIEGYSRPLDISSIETDANAFEILASNYGENSEFIASLEEYFSKSDEYSSRLEAIKSTYKNSDIKISKRENAKRLFKNDMYLSASRIDDYYSCAFRYFCKFGLGARPRTKARLDPMQTGTVIHYVLECIIKKHSKKGIISLTTSELKMEVDFFLRQYLTTQMGDSAEFSARFKYQFMRLSKMLVSVIERLKLEFEESDFVPEAFELVIGDTDSDECVKSKCLNLPDGGTIRIKGAVDRVDMFEENGIKYIRVVDYKSGPKDFRLEDILYGINLQMFIYLFTLSQSKSRYNGISGGVLYMHSSRNLFSLDRSDDTESQIKKAENKLYKMKGIILNDEEHELAKHMEHKLEGRFIPAKANKDGVIGGKIATLSQLGAISRKIDALIINMGQSLHNGAVSQNPINGKNHTDTCDKCDYKAICLNKTEITNNEMEGISDGEAMSIIAEEAENA